MYGDPPDERIIERYVGVGVDRIDLSLPHGAPDQGLDAIARLGDLVSRWRPPPGEHPGAIAVGLTGAAAVDRGSGGSVERVVDRLDVVPSGIPHDAPK